MAASVGLPREQTGGVRGERKASSLALVALAVGLIASPLGANPRVDVVSDWAISDNMTALGYSPRVVPLDNNAPGSRTESSTPTSPSRTTWSCRARTRLPARRRDLPVAAEGDRQLGAVRSRHQHRRQPGRRHRLGRPDHPLLELAARRRRSYPAGHPMAGQTIPVTDPARFTTPGAFCGDWPMFREPADPAPGSPSAARKACTSSTSATRRTPTSSRSSTRRAARTPRRSCRISPTTGCSSTRTRRRQPSSASPTRVIRRRSPARGIDIIEVPLANPAAASYLRFEPLGDPGRCPGHGSPSLP